MIDPPNSSTICLDASLVLRMALGGPFQNELDEQWSEWLSRGVRFIAPTLFGYEVTSTIRVYVYQDRLTPEQGLEVYNNIFSQGVDLKYESWLHKRAWEIAQQFNLPAAYDAHYLALAEHYGIEFWTMDGRLYKAVSPELNWVRTIAK